MNIYFSDITEDDDEKPEPVINKLCSNTSVENTTEANQSQQKIETVAHALDHETVLQASPDSKQKTISDKLIKVSKQFTSLRFTKSTLYLHDYFFKIDSLFWKSVILKIYKLIFCFHDW